MADKIQADPQKLLDVAVQFSTKAQDVLSIIAALGNVAKTNIAPSLSTTTRGSFDFLWAAWSDELLGISKATEAMGLALGKSAIDFLALDGQNPTAAETKDITTLKEQFSQFKSTFAADTTATQTTEKTAKTLDPNNPNASLLDTPPGGPSQPPSGDPGYKPPQGDPGYKPPQGDPGQPPQGDPGQKPDGNPIPGPNDKILGVSLGDGTGPIIYQDSKGNMYTRNPGVQWVPPGTDIRTRVPHPPVGNNPLSVSSNDKVVGQDQQGHNVYQDQNNNWYIVLPGSRNNTQLLGPDTIVTTTKQAA